MEAIVSSFLGASILFFVYETDVVVEYAKLFRLNKLFEIDKYEKYLETASSGTYWEYLLFEKRSFLRNLISCPLCTSFWLNMSFFCVYKDWKMLFINLWLTLFLYLTLKSLLKKI